jgi:hypothetical protein
MAKTLEDYAKIGADVLEGNAPEPASPFDKYRKSGAAIIDLVPPPVVAPPMADAPPGPYSEYGDLAAQPWAQGTPPAADSVAPVVKAFSSGQGMRNALVAPPGYVRTPIPFLPFAFRETVPGSGEIDPSSGLSGLKFDPGAAIAPFATPLLDLLEGTGLETSRGGQNAPLAGKVSPEATALLLGTRMGMRPRNALDFTPLERPPSTGDLKAAPLPPDFKAAPMTPEAAARAREAAATPPDATTSTPTGTPATPPTPPTPPTPQPITAPALSAADHQWASGMRARLDEIHAENVEHGIPGSVGAAATPEELARLTPAQMKAYRAQAELGEILAPPVRGEDKSIYVHGSEPTLAEWSGDPAKSQKESLHRERAPNEYNARMEQNNQARVDSYDGMQGTKPQLDALRTDKAAAAERDGSAYMRVARSLDLTPAQQWLEQQMADPRVRESPGRMRVLKQLHDSLHDADGVLKTDPASGWGMHDEMIARLEKAKDPVSTDEKRAFKDLVQFKKIVDGVNSTASDGAFQTFLDNQTRFAQQINAMEELQGFRQRLTNMKGQINANALHKFVGDLAERRARPGTDPAMAIDDDTMHGLINIDKDLKRATNIDLGKSRGSQTNLFFTLAQATGLGAAHLGAAALSHGNPTANLFLQGAMNQAGKMTGNALLRRAVRKGLSPPPGGYDYNPLIPPSAP